jgi:hypothetical protein
MLSALTALRLADIEHLTRAEDGRRTALDELLIQLSNTLPTLSDTLTQTFLSHLQTSRHLARFEP